MARRKRSLMENDPSPVKAAAFTKGQRVWVYQEGGPTEPRGAVPGVVKRVHPAGLAVLVWHMQLGLLTFNVRWAWQVKPRENEAHVRNIDHEIDRRYEEAAII